ncbi:hypothetical protein MJO28_015902 [Puccinia striiformis f. sp. tritici]|uniref:Uncharacterized protein n=1 Tax=Puccinia striiformis f. sp. tritici TaxID=168172 RepID=A0ACC0DQ47_9BASI|nr:hypothetical protein Pst134EB_029767 [Puccinia striiformis f. sp. tritici]KAI7936189.1 hypothetical protein MJO29_015492 [Puccinia striiformis f. sp. tritici]KAI7937003.1 hypothetical protein MJO28_015902 [Puccinia striiformis f. sp. tritici]
MVRIRAAPTPTPRRTRTIKLSRRAQRWNSDLEDPILLQVMMLPKFNPPIRVRYPKGFWMYVHAECTDRGMDRGREVIRQRWIKSIAPRLPNGGYLPQLFQGN